MKPRHQLSYFISYHGRDMACCFQCIPNAEVGVIERFGKFQGLASPGFTCICWPCDSVSLQIWCKNGWSFFIKFHAKMSSFEVMEVLLLRLFVAFLNIFVFPFSVSLRLLRGSPPVSSSLMCAWRPRFVP